MANLPPREPPDLRNRGGQQQPPPGGYPPPGTGPLGQPRGTGNLPPYPPNLPPAPPPPLGGQPGYQNDPYYAPDPNMNLGNRRPPNRVPGLPEITETRIEYLAWGSVVLMLGCSVIAMAVDTSAAEPFLRAVVPLLGGSILLLSAFVQRFLSPTFKVARATWMTAIFGLAFGASQLIALAADSTLMSQLIYFIGFLIIISGVVMIMQVLRPAEYGE